MVKQNRPQIIQKVIKLITEDLYIGGMTCINCQTRIQKALENAKGVQAATVSYADGLAHINYDNSKVSRKQLAKIIKDLGYSLLDKPEKVVQGRKLAGIAIGVLALFMVLSALGINSVAGEFPLAEQGMGLGMLFVIGLLTSLHCVAMCGGINISQCIPAVVVGTDKATNQDELAPAKLTSNSSPKSAGLSKLTKAIPSLQYNFGRVISYTAIGALVGLLGSAISLSGNFKGIIQLVAGVFMVIMALSMLDVIPGLRRFAPHLPAPLARFVAGVGSGKSPLVIGLLNGLMPCGPLQAMQLYALSTASPLEGALSMLVFSLGTVPLMFGLGLISSLLTERFTKKLMLAGASLVMLLGLFMFANGWTLSNLPEVPNPGAIIAGSIGSFVSDNSGETGGGAGNNGTGTNGTGSSSTGNNTSGSTSPNAAKPATTNGKDLAVEQDGIQVVQSTLKSNKYPAIQVEANTPVRWEITAPNGSITGCNNRMIIPEYKIEYSFQKGANVIEFTPTKPGTYRYSCWMGMISSTITVV